MSKFNCVLLIDDDEPTNFLNKLTLKKHGCADTIISVFDGQQALNYLNEHEGNDFPDLILLDINMPLMNGWEFLEEYERMDFFKKPPLIIMLTTSVNPDDEEKSKKYKSISGFMHKPLQADELDKVLGNHK